MPGQRLHMRIAPTLTVALALLALGSASAAVLRPLRHGTFAHYTFALTWQPGFCTTNEGCLPDQPRTVLIGMHGLWASRPRSLIERHISAPQWWRRGCDYYHPSDRAPRLSAPTLAELKRLMPQLPHPLLRHEYDKHVQCFDFDAQTFFATELRMRRQVVHNAFGRYLRVRARGHVVLRTQVIDAFMHAFGTQQRSALQLRCARNRRGQVVLTQMWITLHADAVERFPFERSLMNAPIGQDNCPARFRVPGWHPPPRA